jgi:hypothetical protein
VAPETRRNLTRSASLSGKPLLDFDEERSPGLQPSQSGGRTARSVFGVDTLWEREMARLKEIETKEAEEQRKQEAIEAERLHKKSKKKKKGKEKAIPQDAPVEQPRVSNIIEAPAPPVVQKGIHKRIPPPPNNDETESSSESSDVDAPRLPPPRVSAEGWHSGESDREMDGPVRTTGVGPRYPKRARRLAPVAQSVARPFEDDDSEEDVPLAATVSRVVQRATRLGLPTADYSDSDEEKPLSQLLTKSMLLEGPPLHTDKTDTLPVFATPGHAVDGTEKTKGEDEDEDDKPLGLRVSRFMSSQSQLGNAVGEDDDDRPLAFHPEQQRRTQYNLFLQQHQQQQQQQQQMMLQAQMHQSMMFSPSPLMGPGFFGTPVLPQMMPSFVPAQAPPSPPPGASDMTKFGRVDRWRREIVGGQP